MEAARVLARGIVEGWGGCYRVSGLRCTAAECQKAELARGQVGLICGQGHTTAALAPLFINTAHCLWDEHN